MPVMRVFVVLGTEDLNLLAAKLVQEMFTRKLKGSISPVEDPLYGPALILNHARQVDMIIVRSFVRNIEKAYRRQIDAVIFDAEQLCSDEALKALVRSVTDAKMEKDTLGSIWPKHKVVKVGPSFMSLFLA